jgi:hypothetical protein
MRRILLNVGKFFASFAIVVGVASAIWMTVAPQDARDTLFALVLTAGGAPPAVAHVRPAVPDIQAIQRPRSTTGMQSDAGGVDRGKRRMTLRLPFGGFELQWEVDRR